MSLREADIVQMLHRRYDKTSMGTSRIYTRAAHVPDALSLRRSRIADYIATSMHSKGGPWVPGKGAEWWINAPVFHGHEIKVSRPDWLTELRDPSKAETFRQHMHYWWLVVSDRSIVRDDLPEGWGLMVAVGGGLRAVVQPTVCVDPKPMPHAMQGALLRATATTEARLVGTIGGVR